MATKKDEKPAEKPDRQFPDQPVRLLNMGTDDAPLVQFFFKGDGKNPALNGSTNKPSEIKKLREILEKNGTGVPHWDENGAKSMKRRKPKPKT